MSTVLWAAVALFFIAWLLGFAINVGWWINILLVLSIVAFIANMVTSAIKGY